MMGRRKSEGATTATQVLTSRATRRREFMNCVRPRTRGGGLYTSRYQPTFGLYLDLYKMGTLIGLIGMENIYTRETQQPTRGLTGIVGLPELHRPVDKTETCSGANVHTPCRGMAQATHFTAEKVPLKHLFLALQFEAGLFPRNPKPLS